MKQLLIHNARVIDPSQDLDAQVDILVSNGYIMQIGVGLTCSEADILDASGLVCAPGLVDMHVHLRDPGQTHKEDIFTGCQAAAAGGVTSIACMPNTSPVCDSPDVVRYIVEQSAKAAARVYPVAAATTSLKSAAINDFEQLKKAGAVAVSDDGRPVETADMMERVLKLAKSCGLAVVSHCEETSLVRGGIMNEGSVSQQLGVPGICHAAEDVATAREIALAAATGCPVHICHVSSGGSVALIRDARRRGVPVTGETAPHYFALTDEKLLARDADYRMNPPLRTEKDRHMIIEGLKDGTLTAIATDHAPHTPDEKKNFVKAPNGSIGLETSLAVGITYLVHEHHLSLSELIGCMSTNPANILGIPAGSLKPGCAADMVLFDVNEKWIVDPAHMHSKSCNTPFKGMELYGRVHYTLLGGKTVYSLER